jgi:hypothetical protein
MDGLVWERVKNHNEFSDASIQMGYGKLIGAIDAWSCAASSDSLLLPQPANLTVIITQQLPQHLISMLA